MSHAWEDGFVGGDRKAWHDLATVIPEEVIRIVDVGRYAPKLVNPVEGWELWARDPKTGKALCFSDYKATVRMDEGLPKLIAPVGRGYQIVQGVESLEFMDELLSHGEAIVHSAGTLEEGRKYFVCCILPDFVTIPGSAPMPKFVTLANSFDGSLALKTIRHAQRVECLNTLNSAIASASATYEFRHTENIMSRVQEARRELSIGHDYWKELERVGTALVQTSFGDKSWQSLQDLILPEPQREPDYDPENLGHRRRQANWERERDIVNHIYRDADNLGNIRGTAWAAFNAWVEFSDYAVRSRNTQKSSAAENRIKRTLFDTSLKDRALETIQELVGVA